MPKNETRSCSIENWNLVLISFNFENERSAKAVETEIVSRAVDRLSTLGSKRENNRQFLILRKICGNIRKFAIKFS